MWEHPLASRGRNGGCDASLSSAALCPDQSPELQPWNPGHDPDHYVHIGRGRALLLAASATVNSIHVSQGGKLVPDHCRMAQQTGAGCPNSDGRNQGPVLRVHARALCGLRGPRRWVPGSGVSQIQPR